VFLRAHRVLPSSNLPRLRFSTYAPQVGSLLYLLGALPLMPPISGQPWHLGSPLSQLFLKAWTACHELRRMKIEVNVIAVRRISLAFNRRRIEL